ncbi:substrate-binding domain-containing protein [Polymorphum gilvum]|uniref:ABC-type phosphate transport system periplasmic component-like protein n=1 Tax=Polymorphum gilvum (strain LMG 25793 / CGMCC 1.9160 / SL003B-26A1) TaxID=991905 RepID=F2IY90_POLGS|nr:substrate-binding domain-containing protein [Polymorphum gilvum]ADZ71702.1 ABC-type phosphate transport system periplasmic component-like protein [Polymorphum gilvum SL003B-26A1]
MKFKTLVSTVALAVAATAVAGAAQARDQIKVVGSSTVFPYTQGVAEEYANKTGSAAPVLESTGTGGGFKVFCGGVGPDHPDMTGASRAIKDGEKELCKTNGVTDVTEVLIGYDGLSIAHSVSGPELSLTNEQIFKALAAELPDGKGGFVANPNKSWSDIDASLPNVAITVFGPPPTSGTRDAFVELAMHDGCKGLPGMADLQKADAKKWNEVCSRMRQDGAFIEAGENDNLIVQRLQADANALGIFGYSFLYENQDTLKGVAINGVLPSLEAIGSGDYVLSRPLFNYVKNAHRGVIPGLNEFLAEYVSEDAIGDGGYLSERGLVPLPADLREKTRETVTNAVGISF